mmetsp:Transcript_4366/g.4126  ORF Transcript_4366/g.4126 Transcript_4366/m.4126 type:complete len:120 (+) Transcript_4366:3-362(+)
MNRQVAIASRLLYDQEKIKEHELHITRLKTVKSAVDTKAPPIFNHLQVQNKKKTKHLLTKYIDQQNENRILLKKMMYIDLKPSTLNPQRIFYSKQTPSSTSLNRVQRLRELVRVNEENK